MNRSYLARLTVLGKRSEVRLFARSRWQRAFRARFVELYEQSPARHTWWFETDESSAAAARRLSRRYPGLVVLLETESTGKRKKSLLVGRGGALCCATISY